LSFHEKGSKPLSLLPFCTSKPICQPTLKNVGLQLSFEVETPLGERIFYFKGMKDE
jgi:hypothetical protein